ncbi:hypothetical protein NPIL_371221 [Nephila pilipes]|uniref:Uncharacterized protein n=1 Tax=Nephila pilipes TaxID=299642 RepID=A0A8X6Q9E1_NEPPI|nr:hypothetical protein NPIL_371221 [Nephila pilipes]
MGPARFHCATLLLKTDESLSRLIYIGRAWFLIQDLLGWDAIHCASAAENDIPLAYIGRNEIESLKPAVLNRIYRLLKSVFKISTQKVAKNCGLELAVEDGVTAGDQEFA